jgi:hypothetical protein
MGMPRLRINTYMHAAIARSSFLATVWLAMACVATLTRVSTRPLPTPNTASARAKTAFSVRSSSKVNRPQATSVTLQPSQTAYRKRPTREVRTATMTDGGEEIDTRTDRRRAAQRHLVEGHIVAACEELDGGQRAQPTQAGSQEGRRTKSPLARAQ